MIARLNAFAKVIHIQGWNYFFYIGKNCDCEQCMSADKNSSSYPFRSRCLQYPPYILDGQNTRRSGCDSNNSTLRLPQPLLRPLLRHHRVLPLLRQSLSNLRLYRLHLRHHGGRQSRTRCLRLPILARTRRIRGTSHDW